MSVALRATRPSVDPPSLGRALIERSPFPTAELEGDRHVVREANAAFCLLVGCPEDSIVGRPYADVVRDESSLAVLDRVYRSGSCELHCEPEQTGDQPAAWSYVVWPVLDTAGRTLGVILHVVEPTLFQRARAMNEALMISIVHQHELRDIAEVLNVRHEAEIQERKRAEAELSMSEARFRALVAMSSDWYWEQDENFRFLEVSEPTHNKANFVPADYLGKTRWELPSAGIGEEQWAEHRDLLRQHRPFRNFEYQRLNASGETIWISVNGDPVFDGTGKFRGYRGTGRDISERKRHEEQIELIMREVSHREKNVLSLVMAVARQTANATPEQFLARFSARLRAIAANQDLLVKNLWQGIEIDALVRAQLAPFQDLFETRIRFGGPELRLGPGAAQIIGIALHELATNSGKYGALAHETGRIELAWSVHQAAAGPRFALSWVESGGPPIAPPTSKGFGSTVIGRMARAGLDADISLDFPSTGLRWSLDCPASTALDVKKT